MDLHSTRTGQIHGKDLRLDRAAVPVRPGRWILSLDPGRAAAQDLLLLIPELHH